MGYKIARQSKIVQEDQLVLASVGSFEIQRATGQIGLDAGGVFYREYVIPNPASHAHAEASGLLHRDSRTMLVRDLTRLENIDATITKIRQHHAEMMVTSNALTLLPQHHMELSQEGRVVWPGDNIANQDPSTTLGAPAGCRRPLDALLTLNQVTLPCDTAMLEAERIAITVLQRFTDADETEYVDSHGVLQVVPAAMEYCASPLDAPDGVVTRIAAVMQSRMVGTSMHERIECSSTDVLFAIQRARVYGRLLGPMIKRRTLVDPAERFYIMKLFSEALCELAGVLDQKITFSARGAIPVRAFEMLRQNLTAVAIVDEMISPYFGHMPHAEMVRHASSKEKWTLVGWPAYGRQLYQLSEREGSELEPLAIAGDQFEVMLPMGLGDRGNPGDYRTTRALSELALRIRLPIIPDILGDGSNDLQSTAMLFNQVVHTLYDRVSPFNYQGRGLSPGEPPEVLIDVKFALTAGENTMLPLKMRCWPVTAHASSGATLTGLGTAQPYACSILAASEYGVFTKNAAWMHGSEISERISSRPAIEPPNPTPLPWAFM